MGVVGRKFERKTKYPGVAKFGIALEWGSRGRWFESSHSDHEKTVLQLQDGLFN